MVGGFFVWLGFFIASISDAPELNQDYPHFRDWQADVKRHCESATLSNHSGGNHSEQSQWDLYSDHQALVPPPAGQLGNFSATAPSHFCATSPDGSTPSPHAKETALTLPPTLLTHRKNQPH